MSLKKYIALVFLLLTTPACIVLKFMGATPIEPSTLGSRYADITQSINEDGYPQLGDPDAPVSMVVYSSFDCTHCMTFAENVFHNIIGRISAGEVFYTYVPLYGFGSVPNGEGAALAAICAGQQGVFWDFHDLLYSWQPEYGQRAYATDRLRSGASLLGLDFAHWEPCLDSQETANTLISARNDALSLSTLTGIPDVYINGIQTLPTLDEVNAAIDAALVGS